MNNKSGKTKELKLNQFFRSILRFFTVFSYHFIFIYYYCFICTVVFYPIFICVIWVGCEYVGVRALSRKYDISLPSPPPMALFTLYILLIFIFFHFLFVNFFIFDFSIFCCRVVTCMSSWVRYIKQNVSKECLKQISKQWLKHGLTAKKENQKQHQHQAPTTTKLIW